MSATLDDFGRDVLLCAHKRVCPEAPYAVLGVDGRERGIGGAAAAKNDGRSPAWVGLLAEVKVRKHDMARLMKEDICT